MIRNEDSLKDAMYYDAFEARWGDENSFDPYEARQRREEEQFEYERLQEQR